MVDQRLIIEGNSKISGEITLQGSKNSSLPIMSATLLVDTEVILENCPILSDIYAASKILNYLGCRCDVSENTARVNTSGLVFKEIPEEYMCEMRSSIIFLGASLGRFHKCILTHPGGCNLGVRPIDIHIDALTKMGVKVKEEHGILECIAENGLHGAEIAFSFPSVGATENIMLAAVLAKGNTIIKNAAREPEIQDLANFLNRCGAKIKGAGESTIHIEGVDKLHGCTYRIMSDRIVAATLISTVAVTNGELLIKSFKKSDLDCVVPLYEQMGCYIYYYADNVYINAKKGLKAVKYIRTMPYPGFPTDIQPLIMAALCKANGTSVIEETIFENRYRHAPYMQRMGADIKIFGRVAVIEGVDKIYGAKVHATDLRGGAALAIMGLGAEGNTEIKDIYHIDRGYESFEKQISSIGGKIKRINK